MEASSGSTVFYASVGAKQDPVLERHGQLVARMSGARWCLRNRASMAPDIRNSRISPGSSLPSDLIRGSGVKRATNFP